MDDFTSGVGIETMLIGSLGAVCNNGRVLGPVTRNTSYTPGSGSFENGNYTSFESSAGFESFEVTCAL